MTDAPERINILTKFAKHLPRYGHSTEYIRADLFEDLQRENAKLRDFVEDLASAKIGDRLTPNGLAPEDVAQAARAIIRELGKEGQQ